MCSSYNADGSKAYFSLHRFNINLKIIELQINAQVGIIRVLSSQIPLT